MTELLTAAQMRAIERAAIDSGDVTGLALMERAGQGVVEAIFVKWPELAKTDHRVVVLCGPGNNGGDGFVVARLLKGWGWEVEVFLYGEPAKLPTDARANYERWAELGEVETMEDSHTSKRMESLGSQDLIIDAVFGTGLVRPFDAMGKIQLELNNCAFEHTVERDWPLVVAIDVPSGFCTDSGKYLGDTRGDAYAYAPTADLTVSFHSFKIGHFSDECAVASGCSVVKDIGLRATAEDSPAYVKLLDSQADLPPLNKHSAHKYSHGHALILSGGVGKGGAARLAARGALRIGAGLVTVACPPAALQENAGALDAVMLQTLKDGEGLTEALKDHRINALCLGPGLGKGARERDLVKVALETNRPTVLDADALSNSFFDEADALFGKLHENCILTPHAGEFARLFPDIAEKVNAPATKGPAYSKIDATREAAVRVGCVVLFKGADTVIAAPDGRCSVNSAHYERSAPWLATAGSGDVLAGFITGLLARGFAPMAAAETAVWLHVECAQNFGPGLIAEDLPEQLPAVFRDLSL